MGSAAVSEPENAEEIDETVYAESVDSVPNPEE